MKKNNSLRWIKINEKKTNFFTLFLLRFPSVCTYHTIPFRLFVCFFRFFCVWWMIGWPQSTHHISRFISLKLPENPHKTIHFEWKPTKQFHRIEKDIYLCLFVFEGDWERKCSGLNFGSRFFVVYHKIIINWNKLKIQLEHSYNW